MKTEYDPTIASVRKHLDAEVDGLDNATRGRLRAIRLSALSAAHDTGRRRLFDGLPGFGTPIRIATATGAILLAALMVFLHPADKEQPPLTDAEPMASMGLLASAHDMEFYRNLEFITWYAEAQRGQ